AHAAFGKASAIGALATPISALAGPAISGPENSAKRNADRANLHISRRPGHDVLALALAQCLACAQFTRRTGRTSSRRRGRPERPRNGWPNEPNCIAKP